MGRSVLLCSVLMSSACSVESIDILASLPPDTAWTAVLLESEAGSILGSTGLVRRTPGARSSQPIQRVSGEVTTIRVLAFTDGDLAALSLPDEATLYDSVLVTAAADGPVLPTASWTGAGTLIAGRAQIVEDDHRRDLGTAWLPACPTLFPEGTRVSLDVDCALTYCAPTVRQIGCTIEARLDACDLPFTGAKLNGRGHLIDPTATEGSECTIADTRTGAAFSVRCGECTGDFYSTAAPLFDIRAANVLDVEDRLGGLDIPPRDGYLRSIATLEDRLAIATDAGTFGAPQCDPLQASEVVYLDSETLERTGTSTAPPCLLSILRDPAAGRTGFLGIYGHTMLLGRFDGDGDLLASVPLEGSNRDGHWPIALAIAGDPPRIVVASKGLFSRSYLYTFDLETLELKQTFGYDESLSSFATASANEAALAHGRTFELFDLDTGVPAVSHTIADEVVTLSRTLPVLYYLPEHQLAIGGSGGRQPLMHALSRTGGWLGFSRLFEDSGTPMTIDRLPGSDGRLIVGLATPDQRAIFSVFEPRERRFLPGSVHAGFGRPSSLITDHAGRTYALLPWSGKVLRIRY